MSRKQPKRRAGNMVFSTIAGIFILAVVCGVGFGVASASPVDDAARAGAFGYNDATTRMTTETQPTRTAKAEAMVVSEQTALASTSTRTIDAGMKLVDDLEREAAEKAAIENAKAVDRAYSNMAKQGESPAVSSSSSEEQDSRAEYDLPAVDWTVGKDAFVAEWAERIDAFLQGSNLAGYGKVFAEAAWENGVDPRWSPAISNTESGKGTHCFLPHNAWGWGSSSWGDWESAIRAHVAGLASGYGYSITREAASIYCPPNQDHWYNTTAEAMASI